MPSGRVLSYEQAVTVADRVFARSGRLDMDELAVAASVSRATLYRVVRGRDRLLGDVLWRQGSQLLDHLVDTTPGHGLDRLVAVADRFSSALLAFPPVRTLLRDEPETALRVLFLPQSRVHERFVARWRALLEQAQRDGELAPALDPGAAAHLLARVGESQVHADLLGDPTPGPDLVARLQRALLRALEPGEARPA